MGAQAKVQVLRTFRVRVRLPIRARAISTDLKQAWSYCVGANSSKSMHPHRYKSHADATSPWVDNARPFEGRERRAAPPGARDHFIFVCCEPATCFVAIWGPHCRARIKKDPANTQCGIRKVRAADWAGGSGRRPGGLPPGAAVDAGGRAYSFRGGPAFPGAALGMAGAAQPRLIWLPDLGAQPVHVSTRG